MLFRYDLRGLWLIIGSTSCHSTIVFVSDLESLSVSDENDDEDEDEDEDDDEKLTDDIDSLVNTGADEGDEVLERLEVLVVGDGSSSVRVVAIDETAAVFVFALPVELVVPNIDIKYLLKTA